MRCISFPNFCQYFNVSLIPNKSEPKKPSRINISDKKGEFVDMPDLPEDFSEDSDSECEENHQDFVNKIRQILHTSCDPKVSIAHLYSNLETKENVSKSVPCCCPCSERSTCASTRCPCRKRGIHCLNCRTLNNGNAATKAHTFFPFG